MKINYIKNGDYLIPKLGITTSTTNSINRFGLLKLNYIKKHKKQIYRNLLINKQLTDYLSSVSNECNIKFETTMNNYKNVVDEVILKEDIYI